MSEDLNPYAPPKGESSERPPVSSDRAAWQVEEGRLLVRDGAVLPDICILSGAEGRLGSRMLIQSRSPLAGHRDEAIHVQVFRSHRGVLMNVIQLLAGPLLGTAAGLLSFVLIVGDGSATTASISTSLSLIVLGGIVSLFRARKAPRIAAYGGSWHELQGAHLSAIEWFRETQENQATALGVEKS